MSLCDSCYSPGYCCKSLSIGKRDEKTGDLMQRSYWDEPGNLTPEQDMINEGLPYRPFRRVRITRDPETGKTYSSWSFNCSQLTPEGRCGIYENRPQICRDYQPREDALCCHYHGEGINITGDPD